VKVNSVFINITSEQPNRLLEFYTKVVGLPLRPDMGDHAVDAGAAVIGFDSHSNTKGATKEPSRVLINLFVDDIKAEQSRLEAQGVSFVRRMGQEYWGGVISTFTDPDGNYIQIIEYRPESAHEQVSAAVTASL
jgi:predicted enzyme related to lactoylglutathione lyase